ncbi:hypothetical protein [Govanella unica]|uniref:Uncharacterized protein n=1 Tax=Govanella unica TaxID=2975056 RepID=A0A9X3TVN1_9PROT|nr:hypothetical protein [Govania unica]MDA5192628.1 hypothetical protein [Govania unica]
MQINARAIPSLSLKQLVRRLAPWIARSLPPPEDHHHDQVPDLLTQHYNREADALSAALIGLTDCLSHQNPAMLKSRADDMARLASEWLALSENTIPKSESRKDPRWTRQHKA